MKLKKENTLYHQSLFIFRRDLRLEDNTALNAALEQSQSVLVCFIFDPQQVTDKNDFYSANAVQFMIESLKELEKNIHIKKGRLYLFYDNPKKILNDIIKKISIEAVFVNKDYTPFSIERDALLKKICTQHSIAFNDYDDLLLNSPADIQKKDGGFYSVFTPFYNNARHRQIAQPHTATGMFFNKNIFHLKSDDIYTSILTDTNPDIAVNGGTKHGKKILNALSSLKDYKNTHDIPERDTSHLSAHLKFGTLSVRQVYHAIVNQLGSRHPLIRQLYWRDFFTHIAFHVPTIFGHPYRKKYEQLKWNNDKKIFKLWCNGMTGFPIIDAGMRQLNQTGFMHNRVRMIVASFLIKDLHINWLWGEKYFAQHLVDYDPAVNNGNWQWCASTGCDSQPYFRIFNPWLQQKKYDPECTYIKKWIPELKKINPKIIHSLHKKNSPHIEGYPEPIVDHAQEVMITKAMYKKV